LRITTAKDTGDTTLTHPHQTRGCKVSCEAIHNCDTQLDADQTQKDGFCFLIEEQSEEQKSSLKYFSTLEQRTQSLLEERKSAI